MYKKTGQSIERTNLENFEKHVYKCDTNTSDYFMSYYLFMHSDAPWSPTTGILRDDGFFYVTMLDESIYGGMQHDFLLWNTGIVWQLQSTVFYLSKKFFVRRFFLWIHVV